MSVPTTTHPKKCHAAKRLLAALPGVIGAWINRVLADWNCSKLSRGKASKTSLASANLSRTCALMVTETSEAEDVLQRFEKAYQALLAKLNLLSGEGSLAD